MSSDSSKPRNVCKHCNAFVHYKNGLWLGQYGHSACWPGEPETTYHEPVAEPAEASIVAAQNLRATAGSWWKEPKAEPAEPSASPDDFHAGGCNEHCRPPYGHYYPYPQTAPQPVAGEGPQDWELFEDREGFWHYWATDPRNGERQKFGPFYKDDAQYCMDRTRASAQRITTEGTPKLEEIKADTLFGVYCGGNPESIPKDHAIFWIGWQRVADYVNILRPFITPACSPPSFDDGLETAAQLIERVCQGCDCKHSEAYAKLIRARKGKAVATPASTGEANGLEIDQAFAGMADDAAYQKESAVLAHEFDRPEGKSKGKLRKEIRYLKDRIGILEAELKVARAPEHLRSKGLTAAAYIECCPTCASDDKVKQGRLIRNYKEVLCLDRWHLPDLTAPTSVPQAEPPK